MSNTETTREEYARRDDIDFKATTEMAALLLPKLLAEGQYTTEEKSLFLFCRNVVENFIYREVLNLNTPLELKIKRNQTQEVIKSNREEFLARLSLSYLLHENHNRRLDRCSEELYSLKRIDDYLCSRILSVARKSPDHPERKKFFCTVENKITVEEIFNTATKMSLTYISPDNHLKRIWQAPNYNKNDAEGFDVTLTIATFRDKEFKTYESYIQYLLKKERNSVGDFTSTALWKNAMEARFSRDSKLETLAASDVHLILFCLALGMNSNVFNQLVMLRNIAFNGEEIVTKQPPITEREKIYLLEELDHAEERLRCARNEEYIKNKKDIVRRVLVNVSIDLIKRDMLPVVVLSDEEIARADIEQELVEKYYDHNTNGQRIFKKKTVNPH